MIIDVDDLKVLRNVGLNVDPDMLIPYCEEAEKHDVMPILTPVVYRDVEAGKTSEKWRTLLDGGYYGEEPDICYLRGLKLAIGYIAYSRAVMASDVSLTNFGAVRKYGINSENIEELTRVRVSNEMRKLGDECLRQCKAYLDTCCMQITGTDSITRRKYTKIKKRKV